MKKVLLFLVCLMFVNTAYGAYEWMEGTGALTITGDTNGSDIDAASYQNMTAPLDRLLSGYKTVRLAYASATTITVKAGQVTCSNADGSIRKMRTLSSDLTVTWAMIDTGSEANGTTYYVYLVADADSNDYTATISTSSTTPTGKTCYARIGSFYNDSSGNITRIINDGFYSDLGTWTSRSGNTVYQASTDGFVVCYQASGSGALGITDSSSSPTTVRLRDGPGSGLSDNGFTMPVKAGDYYKVTGSLTAMYWIAYY